MDRRDIAYYNEHAHDVDFEDITSSEENAEILGELRYDDDTMVLALTDELEDNDGWDFVVREGDDWGWLGYFIGRSNRLHHLHIQYLPEGGTSHMNDFIEGFNRNRSIRSLFISQTVHGSDLLKQFAPLLRNNESLNELLFQNFVIGRESAHRFAFALCQSQTNSLQRLSFNDCGLNDDSLAEIALALSLQPQLEELRLDNNNIGRSGCMVLGTLLGSRAPNLKQLSLSENAIDDEGLQAMIAGMATCANLSSLNISGNESITEEGLRSLSTLFQSGSCCLSELYLGNLHIDDDGVTALADGFMSYDSLKSLDISENNIGDEGVRTLVASLANSRLEILNLTENRSITAAGLRSLHPLMRPENCSLSNICLWGISIEDDEATALAHVLEDNKSLKHLQFEQLLKNITAAGWSAFSRLLCDTSSINSTFLSNHTLESFGSWSGSSSGMIPCAHPDISRYLWLNEHQSHEVAILKMLMSHNDFDMKPLFQWKLKCLPMVMDWFERAASPVQAHWRSLVGTHARCPTKERLCQEFYEASLPTVECRKLSALFKFVRGMPLFVIGKYQSTTVARVQSRKRKFGDENC